MSFRASITDLDKHAVWFRAIYILSTIDEYIKITITSDELIVWAINSTDTSLCQVRFSKIFFDEYEFKPHEIVFGENGLQIVTDVQGNDEKLYSFQINARHLSTVSRKPDSCAVNKFILTINNTTTCPETLANRLLVFVELDSLISKEYSPQFEPVKYNPIVINLKYKRKFLDVFGTSATTSNPNEQLDPQLIEIFKNIEKELSKALFNEDLKSEVRENEQLTVADEINYICCDQVLLRNFIENCNVNVTDELKLSINTRMMNITAFTKAIYNKNGGLLKNALSVSNTINTADLEHYCIFTIVDDNMETNKDQRKEPTKKLVFKSKDFKSFISLGLAWRNLPGNSNNDISIWFCHPGDPVLMQMSKGGVKAELVEVTDSNQLQNNISGGNVMKSVSPTKNETNNVTSDYVLSNHLSPLKKSTMLQSNAAQRYNRVSPLKQTLDISPSQSKSGSPRSKINPRRLFVREYSQRSNDDENGESTPINGTNDTLNHPLFNTAAFNTKGSVNDIYTNDTKQALSRHPLERKGTTVGWGKRPIDSLKDDSDNEEENMNDRPSVLKREKLKYMNQDHNNGSNKTQEEEGLGPTQMDKPTGLFD